MVQIYNNKDVFNLDCPDHMKKCNSGKCLPKSFFCDGENDCAAPKRPGDKSEDEDRKSCGKIDESRDGQYKRMKIMMWYCQ